MTTKLTKNFTLEEFLKSDTATERNIRNTPTKEAEAHIRELAESLQSIREAFGKPIKISSGYRCATLNKAVGGATSSQHMTGYAADIKPAAGTMAELKAAILEWAKKNKYDQIIMEQCDKNGIPTWIHFGCRHATKGQRGQILKAKKVNGIWQYTAL